MWKTFTSLAQANVDHYNNHPTRHLIITGIYGMASLVAASKVAKAIALIGNDPQGFNTRHPR